MQRPWVPRDPGINVRQLQNVPRNLRPVADLIDGNTKWWNTSLISRHFIAENAEGIAKIPLNELNVSDKWIWHYTKTDKFTIRSAYHTAVENVNSTVSHQDPPPVHGEPTAFWNWFWKMKAPM